MSDQQISDAEKARRYRRKLVALVEKFETWDRQPTQANYGALLKEADTIRLQLDVEERSQKQASTTPSQAS